MYQMVIGEAGESCAFYIARKLGMPEYMLKEAEEAAYGETVVGNLIEKTGPKEYENEEIGTEWYQGAENTGRDNKALMKEHAPHIKKARKMQQNSISGKFRRGDSVMIYPDKKIGIVCETVNEKGVLRVQLREKKIYINHKRVKLHVAADELYPEDYDFSIIFDSVETRKMRHQMERKYEEGQIILHEE